MLQSPNFPVFGVVSQPMEMLICMVATFLTARALATSGFQRFGQKQPEQTGQQYLGRTGQSWLDWWKDVTVQEHFNSLHDITGTLIGTVSDLPMIAEGANYPELMVGDSPETASFTKYGGYIPLTLELIDRDETRKLRAYARELASAGMRKISRLVAQIFTLNGGAGPNLADGESLFNAEPVILVGGHANLGTLA